MRKLLLLAVILVSGCRGFYLSDIADLTVMPYSIPPAGTPSSELALWFDQNDFRPGPRVYQAEAELRRLPGTPLSYARESDRSWWETRVQTVRDFCVTEKIVYYKVDAEAALGRAILTSRSHC